jgi:hypothetical protein
MQIVMTLWELQKRFFNGALVPSGICKQLQASGGHRSSDMVPQVVGRGQTTVCYITRNIHCDVLFFIFTALQATGTP